jgi:hypothetical protein
VPRSCEQALPGVREHALWGTDQIGTTSLLGGQGNENSSRVGEGDVRGDSGPAAEWRALQAKEAEQAEDAAKEALDAGALAEFFGGPGGRQTGAILLSLRIPGDDGHRPERRVDPGNEASAPVASVEPNDARAQPIEAHGPREQRLGKGGVVAVGGGKEEEQGQARPTAQQSVDAIATQQGTSMVMRGMADGGIGIVAAPSEDRGAIDDQVAPADDAQVCRQPNAHDQQQLARRGARLRPRRHCWDALGTCG